MLKKTVVLVMLLSFLVTAIPTNISSADTNETINHIDQTITAMNQTVNDMNTKIQNISTINDQMKLLILEIYNELVSNATSNATTNETNMTTIYHQLQNLYLLTNAISNSIGQPTNSEGQPINATVFSALSSIAVELYMHRDALKTLGSNQNNLSKYDQSILKNLDARTQELSSKMENESGTIMESNTNNFKAMIGSNSLAASASVFTAIVVIFFVIVWEILGLKRKISRKQEMYREEEYAPGLSVKKMTKPECFGNPDIFDPNSPECQQCMFYNECEREAMNRKAIEDLRQSEETKEETKPQSIGIDYLDKFKI